MCKIRFSRPAYVNALVVYSYNISLRFIVTAGKHSRLVTRSKINKKKNFSSCAGTKETFHTYVPECFKDT